MRGWCECCSWGKGEDGDRERGRDQQTHFVRVLEETQMALLPHWKKKEPGVLHWSRSLEGALDLRESEAPQLVVPRPPAVAEPTAQARAKSD